MGMFDDVQAECICPVCHAKVTGFQSKDHDCELNIVQPAAVSNFYTSCQKCGCWLEFHKDQETESADDIFILTVEGKFDPKKKERPTLLEYSGKRKRFPRIADKPDILIKRDFEL